MYEEYEGLINKANRAILNAKFTNPAAEIRNMQEAERASKFHKRLIKYVKEFDSQLDQEHEVGIKLVSFGQNVEFSVISIGYFDPKLITFYGEMEDGSKVQLIQHVNQISFLLVAAKRKNPEQPKHPFGFRQPETDSKEETACSQSDEEV